MQNFCNKTIYFIKIFYNYDQIILNDNKSTSEIAIYSNNKIIINMVIMKSLL